MMPSSTTNSSMKNNNTDRKRRGISVLNSKKIRRSELIPTERSTSTVDPLTKRNYLTPEYSLATDKNFQNRLSTFRQIHESYQRNESDNGVNEIKTTSISSDELVKTKGNSTKHPSVLVSPIITSTEFHGNSSTKLFKLTVPQSTSIKMLSDGDGLASALRIPTKIQLTKTLSIPNEINSSSIHSESSTTIEKEQTIEEYPLTPPPPILDHSQNWSVPPTSELSPTSLTSSSSPDDSFIELDLKINQISSSSSSSIKRRYRSLSFSCPLLPYSLERNKKPITPPYKSKSLSRISNGINRKVRSISPVIKYSSIERLKRRRRDHQIYEKRLKLEVKNEDEQSLLITKLLNEMIEQIEAIDDGRTSQVESMIQRKNLIQIEESRSTVIELKAISMSKAEGEERVNDMNHQEINTEQKTILRRSKKSIRDENHSFLSTDDSLLKRQTSTPLSFHSIPSSLSTDDQSIHSPHSVSKTHIFTDIVNELIKGAKGLDKLSCSLINFTNSIHNFIRLTMDKQNEQVENLQYELEKKCSSQLTRANIFCTKKIQYFINKHSILTINEHVNEITLIVKYFYLYVLSLNHRKQENEYELILTDLINRKYTYIDQLFCSSILTTIIEEFILPSSLANDYLSAQPIVINQIEYSVPFIQNLEYEQELLDKNDTSQSINPFSNLNDLEEYLQCCEHISTSIPYYPIQPSVHPSMYYLNYPSSGQYYYPPTSSSDLNPYYYHSPYSNSQQPYGYNRPPAYYNSLTPYRTHFNEQYNYYYNQQTSYNSTNDIPLPNNNVVHQSYRRVNSNVQKKYSNPSLVNPVFEPSNVPSPQSKSTNSIYPS